MKKNKCIFCQNKQQTERYVPFCGPSCEIVYNMFSEEKKSGAEKRYKYYRNCAYCNKPFTTNIKKKEYCDRICYGNMLQKKYAQQWVTGIPQGLLKLRFEILKRDNFTCQYCGRTAKDGAKLQIDHIKPRSKKGNNSVKNLTTSCWECNQGKGDVLLSKRLLKKT